MPGFSRSTDRFPEHERGVLNLQTNLSIPEKTRLPTLDVLRGIAILGILLANISIFGGLEFQGLTVHPPLEQPNAAIDVLTAAFVNGKFRSTLAVLFGAGLWIYFQRHINIPNWRAHYIKRMAILTAIGFLHMNFMWWGDILFIYGIMGMITCFFVGFSQSKIKITIFICGAIVLINGINTAWQFASEQASSFASLDKGVYSDEILLYQKGSYFDQVSYRFADFAPEYLWNTLISNLEIVLALLPLFLIGLLLGRSGFFAAPMRHPARTWLIAVGLGLGLPLNLIALMYWGAGTPAWLRWLIELVFGPLLALGLVGVMSLFVERFRRASLISVFARVGQIALSCYLMQTLLCTAIFYSWGGGLFAKLNRLELLGVVLIVWVINIVFALIWTRLYAYGPVEWLWRSLSLGRRLPLRRRSTSPASELEL